MIKTIKTCSDPESLPIGASSVVAGASAVAYMGNFEIFSSSLCLIFMMLLQVFCNLLYRYSVSRQSLGGGIERYMIAQAAKEEGGNMSMTLLAGVTGSGILTATVGVTLLGMCQGMVLPVVALVTGLVIYVSFFGPRPMSRRPFGLILTFLMFGPVAVMTVTYLQANLQAVDPVGWNDLGPAFAASLIVGLYAVNSQLAYNVRSYEFDLLHGKRTLVTMLGPEKGRNLLILNGYLAAAIALYGGIAYPNPHWWVPIVIYVAAAVVNNYVVMKMYSARTDKEGMEWRRVLNWICLVANILFFVYAVVWGHHDPRMLDMF